MFIMFTRRYSRSSSHSYKNLHSQCWSVN